MFSERSVRALQLRVKGYPGTSSLHCILAEDYILCAAEKSKESPTNRTGESIVFQQSQLGLMLS